jgi:hypothetical protein
MIWILDLLRQFVKYQICKLDLVTLPHALFHPCVAVRVSPGGQHDEGVVKSDTEQQEHAGEVDRLPRVAAVRQQAPGSFASEIKLSGTHYFQKSMRYLHLQKFYILGEERESKTRTSLHFDEFLNVLMFINSHV